MRQAPAHSRALHEDEAAERRDVVLGAPALLGIFFVIAVVCALCFGFGYARGHSVHVPGFAAAKPVAPATPVPAKASPSKPAPGAVLAAIPEPSPEVATEIPVRAPREIAAASAQPAVAGAGTPMVQIAAVSRAGDAETLAGALRRDGFAAVVRSSPADHFYHVQVGPFATLASAKAMRARLADRGYNAFVKP